MLLPAVTARQDIIQCNLYFLGIALGDASTTVLRKKADDGNLKGLMGRPLKKTKKKKSLINSAVCCATDTTKPVEHFNILSLLCVIYNILFKREIQTTEGLIPSLV